MAITFVGKADAAATSATLPAFNANDVAFVFAFRDGSTTAPSLPAGWTNIDSGGANTCSFRCGFRVLIGADTTTGVWTNATEVEVIVLRGVDLGTLPYGVTAKNAGASTSMNWPALATFRNSVGGSWVVCLGCHRTATDVSTVALGTTTNETPGTTSFAMHDVQGATSWSSTSKTVNANSGWETIVLEVLASGPAHVSQLPVEVAELPDDAKARLSQLPVEVAELPTDATARLSQQPVEAIYSHSLTAVLSQLPVEVVRTFIPPAGLGFMAYIID